VCRAEHDIGLTFVQTGRFGQYGFFKMLPAGHRITLKADLMQTTNRSVLVFHTSRRMFSQAYLQDRPLPDFYRKNCKVCAKSDQIVR
jgi:hypothetical protein